MNNEQKIKHMVQRFLGWKLPEDFTPDCGISFEKVYNKGTEYEHTYQPVGTNLFSSAQAEAMVRYITDGLDNTTNPLTAAIEEAKKEFTEWYSQYLHDFCDAPQENEIHDFYSKKMQQVHALGKQEGMNEGAESAVELIYECSIPLKSHLKLDDKDCVRAVEPKVLAAARTAHREDIPVGRCECDGPYTCKTHEGEFTFCTNGKCLCHVRTVHRGDHEK